MGAQREQKRKASLRRAARLTWGGRALALLAVVGFVVWIADRAQHRDPKGFAAHSVHFRSCLVRLVAAKCGTLAVPEDPEHPQGRKLHLLVAVLPAARQPAHGALFYLEGGPGGAASESLPEVDQLFGRVGGDRDLVMVDQRGTGGSNPIMCPPTDASVSDVSAVATYVRRCFTRFGPAARFYTTAVAADDLERVRKALGYGRIDLFGGSYGATVAQVYAQLHPRSVRTMTLDGGSPLGVHLYELEARNAERALHAQLGRCTADPACRHTFPDTQREIATLLARGPRHASAYGVPVSLDADAVASAIRGMSLTASSVPLLPAAVHAAVKGDYTALADAFADDVGMKLDTRARLVTTFEILCSEPWAQFNPAVVRRDRGDSYFGAVALARSKLFARVCRSVPRGVVPAGSESQKPTDVPTLLLAGSADPLDPPSNLDGWKALFPNGRLVVVPGGTHGVIGVACIQRIVADFILADGGEHLDARCAAGYRPPPFTF
jgi:pimeloyl-ACP methyl ester carboxylesterase